MSYITVRKSTWIAVVLMAALGPSVTTLLLKHEAEKPYRACLKVIDKTIKRLEKLNQ